MGTRGLVHIHNDYPEYSTKIIVTMYRQYDCYPEGIGRELATWLLGFELPVDPKAFRHPVPLLAYAGEGNDARQVPVAGRYNGAMCLAAQMVCAFKLASGMGDVYIHRPGDSNVGEEYTYNVHTKGGKLRITCHYGYHPSEHKMMFDGSPAEMLVWIDRLERERKIMDGVREEISNARV